MCLIQQQKKLHNAQRLIFSIYKQQQIKCKIVIRKKKMLNFAFGIYTLNCVMYFILLKECV